MFLHDALKVIESLGYIDVIYKNHHVWLENVNERENTARVRELETGEIREVPIHELKEASTLEHNKIL